MATGGKETRMETTTRVHLVPQLRIIGATPHDLMVCELTASLFSLPCIVNSDEIKVDERGV
jgi:hypothetical protein